MSAEDFPLTRSPKSDCVLQIPSSVLAAGINKTSFASAADTERDYHPERCGVFLDFKADKTVVVATDTRRCAAMYFEPFSAIEQSVLLSKRMASNIISVFGQSESNLNVSFDNSDIKIESPESTLCGKLIEATFPNYNVFFGHSVNSIVTATADELIKAIDRIMLYCPFNSSVINVKIDNDIIKLNGENIDFSLSAEEEVSCSIKQGGGEFLINGRWMQECLQKIKTQTVEVSFGNHPAVYFNPIETEENYLFAVSKSVAL